jgi:hypothetical protein
VLDLVFQSIVGHPVDNRQRDVGFFQPSYPRVLQSVGYRVALAGCELSQF